MRAGPLGDVALRTVSRLAHIPAVDELPTGRLLELPGRGRTFLVDTGPPPDDPDAPTLVLLHALACTGLLTWYPSLTALAKRYRVIVFDQRWHGAGPRSPKFRLEDCADDVAAVAGELGLHTVIAVGYSMGSLVAQLTWRRHPELVSGAVFAASTTSFARPGREARMLAGISAGVGRAAEWRCRMLAELDEHLPIELDNRWAYNQFRSTSASAIAAATAAITRFDSSPWITGMHVPTAVVLTRRDRAIRPARQRRLAELLPDATTYEIDAGHAACVLESDRFTPALLAACASVAGRIPAPARP
ncbi:MAG TPA: alpha/beta fold hydrolase [Jatrophihabitantaceae bacterium]|nr:alpha/beta fold hydrolase [Jatrophihabitantaceae bacterium]